MIDSNKYTVRKLLLVSVKDVMTGEYHYSYRIVSKPQDHNQGIGFCRAR